MRRRATLLQRMHIDGPLLILPLTLAAGSLFRAVFGQWQNWDLLIKQASSFGLGLLSMVVIAQLEPRFMARWVPLGYVAGVLLLVVVDVMGHNAMERDPLDQHSGVIRFQPSEFMKILMPATIAWYLSKPLPPQLKHVGISLILIGVPFVLIVRQPDTRSTSLLIWRRCVRAVHGGVALALDPQRAGGCHPGGCGHVVLLYARLPEAADPDLPRPGERPAGHRLEHYPVESRHRFRRRIWQGWLLGTQSHLDFLPESHTDFIIAVMGEEFGLVGICACC